MKAAMYQRLQGGYYSKWQISIHKEYDETYTHAKEGWISNFLLSTLSQS